MADGRSGFSDNYSRAKHNGCWAIGSSANRGSYTVYVDLDSGRLVAPHKPTEDAWDEDILRVDVEELDAEKLLKYLKEDTKSPYGSYYNDDQRKKTDEERERIIRENNLFPVYNRTKPVPEPYFGLD